MNTIVSYERYVSPDCGADATTTEVTLGSSGGGTSDALPLILNLNRLDPATQLPP